MFCLPEFKPVGRPPLAVHPTRSKQRGSAQWGEASKEKKGRELA